MKTEQEIKERLAMLLEVIDPKKPYGHTVAVAVAIRELEWVLGIREK